MEHVQKTPGGQTQVVVGVMILRQGKVLLGRRKGAHGAGELGFPGGKLEYLEAIEEAARREVREETGVEIENVRFQFVANLTECAPSHFLHGRAHRRLEIRRCAAA